MMMMMMLAHSYLLPAYIHTYIASGGCSGEGVCESRSAPAPVAPGRLLRRAGRYLGFRLGLLLSTLFLFFIATTLTAYILRETQDRMLRYRPCHAMQCNALQSYI